MLLARGTIILDGLPINNLKPHQARQAGVAIVLQTPRPFEDMTVRENAALGAMFGGAKVSEKHANFIVNTGSASATDILNLMRLVQNSVYKQFGIKLEPEVHILGDVEN